MFRQENFDEKESAISMTELVSPSRSYSYQPLPEHPELSDSRHSNKSPDSNTLETLVIETHGPATITLQKDKNILNVNSPQPAKITYFRSPQMQRLHQDSTIEFLDLEDKKHDAQIITLPGMEDELFTPAVPFTSDNNPSEVDFWELKDEEQSQTPLPQGSWQKVKAFINRGLEKSKNPFLLIAKLVLAFISGCVPAVNASVGATGHQPKDLSAELWNSLSTRERALSVMNGASSLIVNMLFTFFFVRPGYNVTKRLFKKPKTKLQLIRNIIIGTLGLSAAIAATAIAFNAMSWTQIFPLIYTLSGISFINYLMSRLSGTKNAINLVRDAFDKDIRNLKNAASELEGLSKHHQNTINQILKNSYQQHCGDVKRDEKDKGFNLLTEKAFDNFLNQAFSEIIRYIHAYPNAIVDKTFNDHALRYGGVLLDTVLAGVVAASVFPTFTQKGFDGINVLTQSSLDSANTTTQFMLGVMQGTASSLLYLYSSFRFRGLMTETVNQLRANPSVIEILLFTTLLTMNIFASESPTNVAEGVRQNTSGIFAEFLEKTAFLFLLFNRIGGLIANLNPSVLILQNFMDSRKPEPERNVKEFAKELRNFNTDKKPNASALQKIGLFNDNISQIRQSREPSSDENLAHERNYAGIN